jgi:hypothetical protein
MLQRQTGERSDQCRQRPTSADKCRGRSPHAVPPLAHLVDDLARLLRLRLLLGHLPSPKGCQVIIR